MRERPLRVFYNASALPEQPAGAGVYTLELGRALAARDDIELLVWSKHDLGFGTRVPAPADRNARFAWEILGREAALTASEADVYHGPHMFTPRTTCPTVATLHDLTFYRLPRRYSAAHRQYYRHLARTCRRAGRVIVPAAAVAADAVRYLGLAPARLRVVAEAPRAGLAPASRESVAAFRNRHGLEGSYLACLGTAEPGKRAIDAIRAMTTITASAPGTKLVLAGNPGRLSGALQREVAALGLDGPVRFLGYIPDEDLAPMLSGAEALIFPSLYEGFGLPPLEAMACGTPVIASDAPAMNDVLRGEATLVPLGNPEGIARAALRLLETPGYREERSASALEFVKRFSWARAAAETVDVYREVAS